MRSPMWPRATARQVNVLLEVFIGIALASGVLSWTIGVSGARLTTLVHVVAGFGVITVAPFKARGSVATGMRRGRRTRFLSLTLAAGTVVTLGLGFSSAAGIWFGVGEWSALWTHTLIGFVIVPVLVWHALSRPSRPHLTDLDRRAVLAGGGALAVSAAVVAVQEVTLNALGGAGGERSAAGSHEVGSFEPASLPRVIWFNDSVPDKSVPDEAVPELVIDGRVVYLDELWSASRPVVAVLDCTGGWWSEQRWDAVPLDVLLPDISTRSVRVTSVTGYSRLLPVRDLLAPPRGGIQRRATASRSRRPRASRGAWSSRPLVGQVGGFS